MKVNGIVKKKWSFERRQAMYFLNKDHAYNFQNMILQDKTQPRDTERMALFYILGGNEDLFMKRKYIYDFKNHEVYTEVLSQSEIELCDSSKALIRLAYNLYNGYEDQHTGIKEILAALDQTNMELVQGSIDIYINGNCELILDEAIDEEMELDFV